MNEHDGLSASALIRRLGNGLKADFPEWLISRDECGRWVAERPGWGVLYGQSAAELRRRLGQFTTRGDVR